VKIVQILATMSNACLLIVVLSIASSSAVVLRPAKSCEYHDTVALNGSILLADKKTLLHNTHSYNPDQWGVYDYVFNESGKVATDIHRRGCICQVTDCIRLCCPWGQVYDPVKGSCAPLADGKLFRVHINVTENGQTVTKDLAQHVHYVHRFVYEAHHCEILNMSSKEEEITLFEDARLLRRHLGHSTVLELSEYCIDVDADGSTLTVLCLNSDPKGIFFHINLVCECILLSVKESVTKVNVILIFQVCRYRCPSCRSPLWCTPYCRSFVIFMARVSCST
jgi:Methuselah N-terminus